MRARPWSRQTKVGAVIALVIVAIYVMVLARAVLGALALGAVLAFLLAPIIRILVGWGLPRWLAIVVAYVVGIGVLVLVPFVLVPPISRSLAALDLAEIVEAIRDWLLSTLGGLREIEVLDRTVDLGAVVDPIVDAIEDDSVGASGLDDLPLDLSGLFPATVGMTTSVLGVVMGIISTAIFALVISIYISIESARWKQGFPRIVPARDRQEIMTLADRTGGVWNDYLRGQFWLVLIIGTLTSLVLALLGVEGALALGVLAGLLEVVPFFGPILAAIPGVTVALVAGSSRFDLPHLVFAAIVVGAYVVIQQLESNVIGPKVLGKSVAVSPLGVLLAIVVGFSAAGVIGALLAVPVLASGLEVAKYVIAKLLDREPFEDEPHESADRSVGVPGSTPEAVDAGAGERRSPGEGRR
jgi:predicted PurR-regulated permease PerM